MSNNTPVIRFDAADVRGRFTCAVSQATFERLTGVKTDAENARHLFADWEPTTFRAAEQAYAAVGRQCGGGLLVELLPASA